MKCEKCKFILIFVSLILLLFANSSKIESTILPVSSDLLAESAIYINSDSDFITLGLDGNGSLNNPYKIQDYIIDVSGTSSGIYVSGTSKYFNIENCTIMTDYIGIFIDNVAANTAIIRDNTCIAKSHDGGGIGVSGSGVLIIDNECNNFAQGVHANQASNIRIINNSISNSTYQGINIRYTSNSHIVGNHISNSSQHAIAIVKSSSSNNLIYKNYMWNNSNTENYNIDGVDKGKPDSEAYDEGINNLWYNETIQIGNYWSHYDYCSYSTYKIDGPSNSEDIYPKPMLEGCLCPITIPAYWGLGVVCSISIVILSLKIYMRKIK